MSIRCLSLHVVSFFVEPLAPCLAMIDLCPVSVWHRRTLHRMERDTEGINHSSLA